MTDPTTHDPTEGDHPGPADGALAGLDDFDIQARAGMVAIWFTPNTDTDQPMLALELLGGQKRFARVWLRHLQDIDWGWTVGDDAVCLWREADPPGPNEAR